MKLIPFILIAIVSLTFLSAQEKNVEINQTDEKGLKQGLWKKQYPNGETMYEGNFVNGKPVGELKRYYSEGNIKAKMIFDENSEYALATLFYENGEVSAKGIYHHNKKDSIWQYYSYYDKTVVSQETYNNGIKHGMEKIFYPTGQVSEEIPWVNGSKEGTWIQYFEDGKKKTEAKFQMNELNGKYSIYYPTGKWLAQGVYLAGARHGTWLFYDENGKIKYQVTYEDGIPDNKEAELKRDQEYYQQIEENLGKFEDPKIEDFFPGGRGY